MGNAAFPHYFSMTRLEEKSRLRSALKSQRKALSNKQQTAASFAIAQRARAYRQLFGCSRILAYSPILGEIDPGLLLSALHAQVYLPRINHFRNRSMRFFQGGSTVRKNMLGIDEPHTASKCLPARHFEAVLVPLVAFDRSGNRLGMGAGFYDRSFAFRGQPGALKRPLLIGLAHHFQEVTSLVTDPWDVPLDAIITDRELILP